MLSRNPISGDLSFLVRYKHSLPGGVLAYSPAAMDISKDNKNLYVVYEGTDVLVNYRIDHEKDTLNVLQIIDYETYQINGLKSIDRIKVRHDGTFVYTSSNENNSLGLFYRNPTNGILSFVHDFIEPEHEFDGLDGITSLFIPSNDRNLYITSNVEECIASYKIDLYLGPDLTICEGDTIILDAGQAYASYMWSTNETTRQIKATTQGYYIVERRKMR